MPIELTQSEVDSSYLGSESFFLQKRVNKFNLLKKRETILTIFTDEIFFKFWDINRYIFLERDLIH